MVFTPVAFVMLKEPVAVPSVITRDSNPEIVGDVAFVFTMAARKMSVAPDPPR